MKRLFVLAFAAAALLALAGLAKAQDANGPACADISDTDWFYSGTFGDNASGDEATVHIFLDTASCRHVTYTLVVLDSLANQTFVIDASASGDGVSQNPETGEDVVTIEATIPEEDRDGNVCLYATTSIGRHVFDRAPDSSCVELVPGGTASGSGFG
jgi:hypothetical protein